MKNEKAEAKAKERIKENKSRKNTDAQYNKLSVIVKLITDNYLKRTLYAGNIFATCGKYINRGIRDN